jgi:hypothetical protein
VTHPATAFADIPMGLGEILIIAKIGVDVKVAIGIQEPFDIPFLMRIVTLGLFRLVAKEGLDLFNIVGPFI